MDDYRRAQKAVCDFLKEWGKPARPKDIAAWTHRNVNAIRSALRKLEASGCVRAEVSENDCEDGRTDVFWFTYVKHPIDGNPHS